MGLGHGFGVEQRSKGSCSGYVHKSGHSDILKPSWRDVRQLRGPSTSSGEI